LFVRRIGRQVIEPLAAGRRDEDGAADIDAILKIYPEDKSE
jgi:hypothetical protein